MSIFIGVSLDQNFIICVSNARQKVNYGSKPCKISLSRHDSIPKNRYIVLRLGVCFCE